MTTIYRTRKVFSPRMADERVWKFFVEKLHFEDAPRNQKYFDWFFADVSDDEILSVGSQWLLDNGAGLFETVLLDMS